jgi:carbonic anhydrase
MTNLTRLLQNNRAWAAARVAGDPHFFQRLCEIQQPEFLWIGCSDSRVPANEIVGLDPGELFVHRNVANVVAPRDSNCLSVVQYAVETLGVRHIIVTGHYGCGGVRAALEGTGAQAGTHIERWLAPLRQLASEHAAELQSAGDFDAQWRRFCEINVLEQVRNLASSDVLTTAKRNGIEVDLHGWIYDLQDGLLRELG